MKIDSVELQRRWTLSWEAQNLYVSRYQLIDSWYNAYRKHLEQGENWSDSYRFPELFGAVQRKFDNLVEFWPEMKVKGNGDEVISLQSAYDHQVAISNLEREKNRVGLDTVKFGYGILFCAPVRYEREVRKEGKTDKQLFYDGLGAERIDPRDFIPAYSALVLHDHTGQAACPYAFRRRIYYYNTFKLKYGTSDYDQKIVDSVQPVTYSGAFSGERGLTQDEGREKEQGQYVVVLEYWDQENDIFEVYANSFANKIYDSKDGIPYSHKQLPFHMYYDYRKDDSIYGIGEVELNMPYNIFRETMLNLMVDNAKLELQPAYVVAGDVNFNEEEAELQPGAIFTLRGNNVGKVGDSIMPYRAGGIPGDTVGLVNIIEDSRITVTGDDTKALYANPNQLATQTLAKREAMQKRIRGNVIRNAVESEFYLANQIISYLGDELAKPYKDGKKTTFRNIKIDGYKAIQDKKESKVEFKRIYGSDDEYYLNPEVAKEYTNQEIEVVEAKLDEQIKRDQIEKLMLFVQQVMGVAQANPAVLEGFDVMEFLKEVSTQLNLDIGKIFPPLEQSEDDIDVVNAEHDQIALGQVPEIKEGEDSQAHYMKHIEYERSPVFKKLSKKAQDAMKKHKTLTLQNVQSQKAGAIEGSAGAMGAAGQGGEQATIKGLLGQLGSTDQGGRAGIPSQALNAGVRAGQSVRTA